MSSIAKEARGKRFTGHCSNFVSAPNTLGMPIDSYLPDTLFRMTLLSSSSSINFTPDRNHKKPYWIVYFSSSRRCEDVRMSRTSETCKTSGKRVILASDVDEAQSSLSSDDGETHSSS